MIEFTPRDDSNYKYNYPEIFRGIAEGRFDRLGSYKSLILNDLFYIVYFVMEVSVANEPFVVQACRDVEEGPITDTLDLWAREHFKSTIITKAEVVQKILRNPEERIAIFSHTRPAAKAFLRSIKMLLAGSDHLKSCFPGILYEHPDTEAPKWSEDDGIIVQRNGYYNEATVEAWGLLEGMPTGRHFTHRVYDDIVTADHVGNPETMKKLKDMFDLSQNLGVLNTGTHRVVGTHYHHEDPLVYIKKKADIHEKLVYETRVKPATDDGTANGKPVLLTQEALDRLKVNEQIFNCQQLLNPTPVGARKLHGELLKEIRPEDIPKGLYKFMTIDPAGDNSEDAWGVLVCGVEPKGDEIGASNVFILDAIVSPLAESAAPEEIARMYIRNGVINRIGVEKTGLSTVEIHVANALRKHGRLVSVENRSLIVLRPPKGETRNKAVRIERAISWPLFNGKLHISTLVPSVYRERLRAELDRFPYWHDDGLDSLSYLYELIKDYNFAGYRDEVVPEAIFMDEGACW